MDEAESYAGGALFALALYCTCVEAGLGSAGSAEDPHPGTWGVPFDDVADAYCTDAFDRTPPGWGWGVVAPDGICGRIFRALGLANSAAVTLLTLPDTLGRLDLQEEQKALEKLVRAYAEHLDGDLSFALHGAAPALQLAQRPEEAPPVPSREASSAASVSPSALDRIDTPPPGDVPNTERPPSPPAAEFERASIERVEEEALRAALMHLQTDPDALQRVEAQNRSVHAASLSEGAILCEPAFGVLPVYSHKASPQSVAVVQAVVTGAVRDGMPQSREANAPRWYDARARVAALRLAHWLRVPAATFTALEVAALSAAAVGAAAPATREQLHKYHAPSTQWLKVGAAAVGGGVLTAVTAGLAAPAIVAGVGTMVGMAGSAGAGAAITGAAASTASVGLVTSGAGAGGAAFYSSKMRQRAADVSEFGFVQLSDWDEQRERRQSHAAAGSSSSVAAPDFGEPVLPDSGNQTPKSKGGKGSWFWSKGSASPAKQKASSKKAVPPGGDVLSRLRTVPMGASSSGTLLVAINGWIASRPDFVTPFDTLDRRRGGAFALVWESKELLEISAAFMKLLKRSAGQQAVQLALYATVQGLATATIWPVAVLNGAHFLDSAFDVACVRAKRGGKLLAHMLMHRTHGDRPVTLLGVSLGARLAFHCCLELHKHGARGIVEHLVLLGAPASRDRRTLEMARSVVAGRCINAYSTADWLLSLSFRTKLGQGVLKSVLGLGAADFAGFEDLDCSGLVRSHGDWCKHSAQVLQGLGLERADSMGAEA